MCERRVLTLGSDESLRAIICDQCGRLYRNKNGKYWFTDAEDMRRQAHDDDWQDQMGRGGQRSWHCPVCVKEGYL